MAMGRRATDMGQPTSTNIREPGAVPAAKKRVDRLEDRNLLQGTAHELFALENGSHGDEQIMGGVRFDDVAMPARLECGFRNVGMAVFREEQDLCVQRHTSH